MNVQMKLGSAPSTRRYDIDWLRVLATLLLFYFHAAKIFYQWSPFYILNDPLSRPLSYISLFIEHWHMPLFFLLAGAASWFALRRRTAGQYLLERVKRLLVPYLFGLLVIVPPQLYFALRHHRPDMRPFPCRSGRSSRLTGYFAALHPRFVRLQPTVSRFGRLMRARRYSTFFG